MKQLLILCFMSIFCGCSFTIVYAPKDVHIHDGKGNEVIIQGSDLKGNSASQSANGKLEIPIKPF